MSLAIAAPSVRARWTRRICSVLPIGSSTYYDHLVTRAEAVEYATVEWVHWFNNRRLLEPIGNIPPAEAEANFHAALDMENMAA